MRYNNVKIDKLYPYTPEDGELLESWLPEIIPLQDVSCQCDVSEMCSVTTACQTDMPHGSSLATKDPMEDKSVLPDHQGSDVDSSGSAQDQEGSIVKTQVQTGPVRDNQV